MGTWRETPFEIAQIFCVRLNVWVLFVNSIVCLFVFVLCLFFVFECFWLGLPAFVVGFPGLLFLQFCSESLILAQDERWRRA